MTRLFLPLLWVVVTILISPVVGWTAETSDPAQVEFFEKRVRPLLAARCFECHQGDKAKGNLHLDSRAGVLAGGDTGPAVVPGDPDNSLLVDAVRYGEMYQMPPKSQLPAEEIATLIEWVKRGAPWGAESATTPASNKSNGFDLQARAKHWCFQPLNSGPLPEVADAGWIRTPVDRYILAGLEQAELKPAPAAERAALLRRVTFDLTGLPPTPEELAAFLADRSPDAYRTVVDRLLASPHYGERWARHWLDLVRYAETCGHEFDFDLPNAYRYRDYVIRAFNADLPYDQFVIEQIAGDLLDQPRRHPVDGYNESIIGTAWFFFGEAVHSPVDVRGDEATRIDNQIDVFAKTFLGLTVSCARCHDHKFDAISTKDYYALAGYLQSSRQQQAFIDPPESRAGTIAELKRIGKAEREACLESARRSLPASLEKLSAALIADKIPLAANLPADDVLRGWAALTKAAPNGDSDFAARRAALAAQLRRETESPPADVRVLAAFNGPTFGGWTTTGDAFGTSPGRPLDWCFAGPQGQFPGQLLTVGTAHSGLVSPKLQGTLRSPTFEITGPKLWYRLYGTGGRVRLILDGLQLIKNPIYGGLEFGPGDPKPHWHVQDLSKWIGHRAYIELVDDGDGYLALEKVAFGDSPPPAPANPLLTAMLDDASLTTASALAERYQATIGTVLQDWLRAAGEAPADAADRAAILAWLLEQPALDTEQAAAERAALRVALASLAEQRHKLEAALAPPRQALALADGTAENERVFIRGSHRTLGDEVPRRFLEVLGGTQHTPPADGSGRLDLARQIISPQNPLPARVIVNRLWHHHFGAGLVRSTDDFGVMGQRPTHPELLDYLAKELQTHGWSLKHLHRMLVLSNTYQMTSQAQPGADLADPQNKLWHRMNVRRLEAESIRDAMLAVSGRANEAMFGPGVMPRLTEFSQGRGRPTDSGPLDGDGRRSIYLAVRRNFLPPMFLAFDYPTPFSTIGRRGTSNVPAQALAMMNNPLVLQLARHWAERVLRRPAPTEERVKSMYLAALAREPDAAELAAALDFVQSTGDADAAETWSSFAHVLFNVKEFIFIP